MTIWFSSQFFASALRFPFGYGRKVPLQRKNTTVKTPSVKISSIFFFSDELLFYEITVYMLLLLVFLTEE